MDENSTPITEETTFEKMLDETFTTIHNGGIVKGTVLRVTSTEVTVDLGYKSDGIILKSEFTDDNNAHLPDIVKPGDEFDVFIIRVNDGDGNVMVSKKKLDNQMGYKLLEQAYADKTPLPGKVTEVIRGGLMANIHGCKAFVPSSQIAGRFVEDLNQFKGKEFHFHILELDRRKRRIVAGRKELALQEAQQHRDALFSTLEVGAHLTGTVSRLVDFGAFIDLGGVDGLIHVSELSWKRVRKASDVLKVGDTVNITVIAIDPEKNKISLTMKDPEANPWKDIEERFPVDSIVEGTVVRLAPFGAFVKLDDGIDGLVHVSQISQRRITKPDEELAIGQTISVLVTAIDTENRKISLSKKQADIELGYVTPEYDDEDDEEPPEEEPPTTPAEPSTEEEATAEE
ncbi:MAG: 30S ribosomal protein S1 [Defluviitaleaceae bacterium]|nr:30S ribosomal protein S1 [Defluviitaleaceae bacterium]MCL2238856.1 30S ribosomal protein S1 [Defluviitaleaceae bacterium]